MKGSKLAARYALYCAAWYLASASRPLSAAFPVGDDLADEEWQQEGDAILAAAPCPADFEAAKRLLRDGGKAGDAARAEASQAVERRHGAGAWEWAASTCTV